MTEADEIAQTIWSHRPGWHGTISMARAIVRKEMGPEESEVPIDNIASALVRIGKENSEKLQCGQKRAAKSGDT